MPITISSVVRLFVGGVSQEALLGHDIGEQVGTTRGEDSRVPSARGQCSNLDMGLKHANVLTYRRCKGNVLKHSIAHRVPFQAFI